MNALVEFKAPRLPYHPAVQERFGIDKGSWKALVEAIYPAAESVDSVVMALSYCKARNLDPFKRPVHIVPVWDSKRRCMVETVWPGISELRTTAMRTGQYAGTDPMAYGPDMTKVLDGVEVTFPEWAQLTVYKFVKGQRVPFTGPEVHWLETYATAKRDTVAPNSMWRKRPRGQLQKCAEAAALRLAFPEELGGEYAAEEMDGRAIGHDGSPLPASAITARAEPTRLHAEFVDPKAEAEAQVEAVIEHAAAFDEIDPETGEIIDPVVDPPAADELPIRDDGADDFPGDRAAGAEPKKPTEGFKTGAQLLDEQRTFLKTWASDLSDEVRDMDAETLNALTSDNESVERFGKLADLEPATADSLNKLIDRRKRELAG